MSAMNSNRGFTLLELMMTISVIAVVAVIAVPSVMDSVSRQAADDVARSVNDAVSFARAQAAATNLAYEMVPTVGSGLNDNGKLEIFQGTSSACAYFQNPNPSTGESALKVREVDLTVAFPTVRLVSTDPGDLQASPICFKPDGRVFQVTGDTTPTIFPAVAGSGFYAGEAVIRLQRMDSSGSLEGPVHAVRIPFNGLARVEVE